MKIKIKTTITCMEDFIKFIEQNENINLDHLLCITQQLITSNSNKKKYTLYLYDNNSLYII